MTEQTTAAISSEPLSLDELMARLEAVPEPAMADPQNTEHVAYARGILKQTGGDPDDAMQVLMALYNYGDLIRAIAQRRTWHG